jgi:hypothetical protein
VTVDEISLTLPADEAFHGVAHLVLGGLAVRLDVTYEHLEDLELALDTVLERCRADDDVTMRVRVLEGALQTSVGPCADGLRAELERATDASLGMRRILEAVCDRIEITDGAGGDWIELTKLVETTTGGNR